MFKKRSRKALSHVDWAMSLAIFLLYLAWFFIFVKPLFTPSENIDVLLDILQDGVEDNLYQDIARVNVFVPGDITGEYEPIIIPYTYDWSESSIALSADYFVIDQEKMFFLGNLSATKKFYIYHPHRALEFSTLRTLSSNDERAVVEGFTANFNGYLLDNIYYDGEQRLSGFTIEVDEEEIEGEGNFLNNTFLSRYQRTTDQVNISSYVFAENPKIYSFISSNDFQNHSIRIDFATYNYTYFYLDPLSSGEISYGIGPNCRYYESGFIDLNDGSSGMLITFNRDIDLRLCSNETNALVRLEFDLAAGSEDGFNIILHQGGEDAVLDYPLNPIVGATETLKTVSLKKVAKMKNRNYDYLKQLFHYPDARDFNITVESAVVSATFGTEHPVAEDIYARKIEGFMLDENYNQERALLTLTVW